MPPPIVVSLPCPSGLEELTVAIEQACKLIARQPSLPAFFKFSSSDAPHNPTPPSDFSYDRVVRWDRALGQLQQCSQMVVALLDGPVDDLSLSAALACDVRVCTRRSFLPAPLTAAHQPLPLWWLASLALHVGALRAEHMLHRRQAIPSSELLSSGTVIAVEEDVSSLMRVVKSLPLVANVPIQLFRRIVMQGFSIEGSDVIGHALAVNSLVITEAVARVEAPRKS